MNRALDRRPRRSGAMAATALDVDHRIEIDRPPLASRIGSKPMTAIWKARVVP